MSRTIDIIYDEILVRISNSSDLSNLNSNSIVAIYKLLAYIMAVSIWSIEQLFDIFKVEQNQLASEQKVHSIHWYRQQALSFLDGKTLTWKDDRFQYDIDPAEDIEPLKVIKHVAIVDAPGELLVKVASTNGPLPSAVEERFTSYINQIKDAGTYLRVINHQPDDLSISLDVYVDPLLINAQGQLISDPSVYPIVEAIDSYFNSIEFNGLVVPTFMIDSIQLAVGVELPILNIMEARYGVLPYVSIGDSYRSDAGYTTIESLDINYILNGI